VRKTFLTFRGRVLAALSAAIAMAAPGVPREDEPLAVLSAVTITDIFGDELECGARGPGRAGLTVPCLGDGHDNPALTGHASGLTHHDTYRQTAERYGSNSTFRVSCNSIGEKNELA
jgi:hypothetical protein